MFENVHPLENLIGLARKKSNNYDIKVINPTDKLKFEKEGWEILKSFKNSVQIRKVKTHDVLLEDRVWNLFFKMKFQFLSGMNGVTLIHNPKDPKSTKTQIDISAIDKEVAIAIECKSSLEYKKRPQFQEELGKFVQVKESFSKAIRLFDSSETKRHCIYIMVLSKIVLTEDDKEKARKAGIVVLDEKDIIYYENLITHLGTAAKYQVFADLLPGKEISGLTIRIPATKTKMGGYNCYSFSISPEYLLKISYVSHRSKGKQSDINTYQRMLAKTRLRKIKEYISEDGIFPTNIILNFEKSRLWFQQIRQESQASDDLDIGILGWLEIKPAFKSAWIIDGQHRLFAYSGHEKSLKSKLVVLAFEGLKPSKQAELFIDINAKQKSVKQSLLQELYAELHWDSNEPSVRISAIISKAIQDLNNDPDFSLFQRIQTTDGEKDFLKCITLTSLFGQIEKKGFFILKEKNGSIIEHGPLWAGNDNKDTLLRTIVILKGWINIIADLNKEWWDIGAGEGGGLSMNDGIAAIIAVLRSVFEILEKKGYKLIHKSNKEVLSLIEPYSKALGSYLQTFDEAQRKAFRDLRGGTGIGFRTRQCQKGIKDFIPDFIPDGLEQWIIEQKQQTNKQTKELIDKIEVKLQEYIITELKNEFAGDENLWWYEGIPSTIRTKTTTRMEEDKNKRGGKEYYFDLIDYKKIILENWQVFESHLSFGKGSKEKKVEWVDFINETRKIVAHASSGKTVKLEDFNKIQEYHDWLISQLEATEALTGNLPINDTNRNYLK